MFFRSIRWGLMYLAFTTFTSFVFSQNGSWELVREPDWYFSLKRVVFRDGQHGFILGAHDQLLTTENGGQNWEQTVWPDSVYNPNNPVDNLMTGFWDDMALLKNNDLWLVGEDGYLLHMPGDGNPWEFFEIDNRPPLRAGCFHQSNTYWLAGYYGEIFRSTDKGQTWETLYDFNNLLWDIHFVDSQTGFVLARTGEDSTRCYKTKDGGFSWEPVQSPEVHGRWMYFLDDTHGWVLGEFNEIFRTQDGGETWEQIRALDARFRLHSLFFLNPNKGWLCGANGLVMQTLDGGATWKNLTSPSLNDIYDIFFIDENRGWIAGQWGLIAHTENGGSTWNWQVETSSNNLYGVHFINSQKGFAVGDRTCIKTTDAGHSWVLLDSLEGYKVYFADNTTGWIQSQNILYKTKDGGNTWNTCFDLQNERFTGISFLNSKIGWAVSGREAYTKVYRTLDGGEAWELLYEFPYFLSEIEFVSEKVGWLAGSAGRIVKTKDGGLTWNVQRELTEELTNSILDIDFVDEQYGWATGFLGLILATTDGGKTWTEQHHTIWIEDQLMSVQFQNREEGWVAGMVGLLLHTTDGGQTWDESYSEYMGYWWADMHFTDPYHGWTVGLYGAVNKFVHPSAVEQPNSDFETNTPEMLALNPNPVKSSTSIIYTVPFSAFVELSVYDILGRKVTELTSQSTMAGRYALRWDGRDSQGTPVPSGTYICCLRMEDQIFTKRITVVR